MSPAEHGPDEVELAELRGRLRGRWKAERRAQEREALHEHWTRRSLIDAVREAMDRGDEVAIHLPGRTLRGHVAGLGRDYAVLRSDQPPPREYAVRLPASTEAGAHPYAGPVLYVEILGGDRASPIPRQDEVSPPTFQAVLQQYDFRQQDDPALTFEVGTVFHPQGLQGTLNAHAGDHLYIRDHRGQDILLPVAAILHISRITIDR